MAYRRKRMGQAVPRLAGSGVTLIDTPVFEVRYPTPAAPNSSVILAATTLANGATTTVTTGFTQPDVPRVLSVTGNRAGQTGNVVLTLQDAAGVEFTETVALNGTTTVEATKAAARIVSAVLPARGQAGDTVQIGTTAKLGLPLTLPTAASRRVLMASVNGVREATLPTIVGNPTNLNQNLITFATALNGSPVEVNILG